MAGPVVQIPETVRAKAVVAGAHRWLADLPSLVADLQRDWSITVGATYDGGTEAYVARAVLADGTPAVLKVLVPRSTADAVNEITVLRLANGEGCARLLRDDPGRGALLLERLGPALSDLDLPMRRRHEILCGVAQRLWRPAAGCGFYERARWLAHPNGLDPVAIWQGGVVERVSTGLLCNLIGLQPYGRQMLAAADRIAQEHSGPL